MLNSPTFTLLEAVNWRDYELLDSGDGLKLERFGKYIFARPELQAMWERTFSHQEWGKAHAIFHPTAEESRGYWIEKKKIPEKWEMKYSLLLPLVEPNVPKCGDWKHKEELRFSVMITPGRHFGVFPESATHWDFITEVIDRNIHKEYERINIVNLFGYTGLASLSAAVAGAHVTHVDASQNSVAWARENQILSGLGDKPIRWIVDDPVKYMEREARRGVKYDGVILDPPKFGRGPKGEVWEIYKSLPGLLNACCQCLSDRPLFVVATIHAVRASALHVKQALDEMMKEYKGEMDCGELVTREKSANHLLSQAVYARWHI